MATKRTKKPAKPKTSRRRPGPRSKPLVSSSSTMTEWNDETIKALREHLQLTQVQMAQELGTRQQTISEWEVGMYKPRGGMARLLTIVAERANFAYDPKSDSSKEA
jgi:DNA-binding transcriptional regulator YiaG